MTTAEFIKIPFMIFRRYLLKLIALYHLQNTLKDSQKEEALLCFLVILISAHVFVSAAGNVPSEWAAAEVTEAVSMGFIPENMQKKYTYPITREEFAEIAIRFLSVQFRLPLSEFDMKTNC